MRTTQWIVTVIAAVSVTAYAQRPPVGNAIRQFVTVDQPVVALTHARVIDGTGAPARRDQTVVLRDGLVAAFGPAASIPVPEGATVIDLTGKTLMPGMVMVHEHLYYPTGPGVYGQLGESFVRLYLKVTLTTTPTVFETFTPGRPVPPGLEVLVAPLRGQTVGSIAVGKQADLIVIAGDPMATVGDVRKVETVFKQGIGFDSARLIASVSGRVGIW